MCGAKFQICVAVPCEGKFQIQHIGDCCNSMFGHALGALDTLPYLAAGMSVIKYLVVCTPLGCVYHTDVHNIHYACYAHQFEMHFVQLPCCCCNECDQAFGCAHIWDVFSTLMLMSVMCNVYNIHCSMYNIYAAGLSLAHWCKSHYVHYVHCTSLWRYAMMRSSVWMQVMSSHV